MKTVMASMGNGLVAAMGAPGAGAGRAHVDLVPVWLGVAGGVVFVVIAVLHLRYLAITDGQRRAWHACHVLLAVGMAAMYAPYAVGAFATPAALWRVVFAGAGVLAGMWALGGRGRAAHLLWLLTAIDLGVMFVMWSAVGAGSLWPWVLAGYLVAEAVMWAVDGYRRVDGATPIVSWPEFSAAAGGGAAVSVTAPASVSLIGELDMGASMIVMALGMAYMLVVMALMM